MKDVNSALSRTWRMLTQRCPRHEGCSLYVVRHMKDVNSALSWTWKDLDRCLLKVGLWLRSAMDNPRLDLHLQCIQDNRGKKTETANLVKLRVRKMFSFEQSDETVWVFFIRIALYFVKINSWTSQLCSQDAEVSWKYISLCKETPHNTQLFCCERYFHRIIIWNFPYSYS